MLRNPNLRSALRPRAVFTLGYIYSDDEISNIEIKIADLKKDLNLKLETFNKIDEKVGKDLLGYAALSPVEKSIWKNSRIPIERLKKQLKPLEDQLSFMRLSQSSPRVQPTVNDVIEYATSLNKLPSEVIDEYEKSIKGYAYPYYIIQKAKVMNEYHRTFVNDTVGDDYKSDFWLDKAVAEEDAKDIQGRGLIASLVATNKERFKFIKDTIKKVEPLYIEDAIASYINKPTKFFTPDQINKIVGSQEITENTFGSECYQMGGFFKSFFSSVTRAVRVLSPTEIFQAAPFYSVSQKLLTPVVLKLVPESFYGSLSSLSQAQSEVLAGRVNTTNIKKGVKAGVILSAKLATAPVSMQTETFLSTSVGKSLDYYGGGLVTSAQNLSYVAPDVAEGKKIDIQARLIDAIKVGAAVAGGGAAIAATTGSNVAAEKTALGKSSLGRAGIQVGAAYASGGSSGATNVVRQQGISKGVGIAEKQGIVKGTSASILRTGVTAAAGGGTTKEIATAIAKTEGTNIAKKEMSQSILGKSTIGTIVGTAAISTATSGSKETYVDEFGTSVKYEVQREAVKRVDAKLEQYGVSVSDLSRLSEGDANKIISDVKNFSEEDLKELLQKEQDKVLRRVELEREKAQSRVTKVQREYEQAYQKAVEFNAQTEAERLKAEAEKSIKEEQARLGAELARIQEDYDKGLQTISNQIENFDSQKLVDQSSKSLGDKILAERDRFFANAYDNFYELSQKYGPQLLAYLMWKYGPQQNYDKFITKQDKVAYKSFKMPAEGERSLQYNYSGLKWLGIGALGLVGLYALSGD